jgi:aspartyl-tRNA(Asn)/glutamyl-tRNA(Gln) amidotransferase subunit A
MARALEDRSISSRELLALTLQRIDAEDPAVRAFLSRLEPERLVERAHAIDERRARGVRVGRYAGVPVAVKDNIAVAGHTLTAGSRILAGYVTPFSATAVARLEAEEVLVVGKTNMDEFGFGSSTENSAYFATRNPRDLDCVPGGSSGGSAAAIAAGMVPWALGSDTGGSVRQPASLCGIVGLRPSYGRVSRYGLVAFASSMDQIGTMASTVDDAAALLQIIAGRDPFDSTSRQEPVPDLARSVDQIRIGVPREYLDAGCESAVLAAVDEVAAVSRQLGWTVTAVSLPRTGVALSAYYIITSVEAASNLGRYDGVKYGRRADGTTYEEMLVRTRTEGFGAEAKRRIMLGTYASSAGYAEQYYFRATKVSRLLAAELNDVFREVDIIISPVSPTTAWRLGEKISDPMSMYLSDVLSVPAALAGIPAAVIPISNDPRGLPVGVQFSGPWMRDDLVVGAARAVERALST